MLYSLLLQRGIQKFFQRYRLGEVAGRKEKIKDERSKIKVT